jgi:hypothetical protein
MESFNRRCNFCEFADQSTLHLLRPRLNGALECGVATRPVVIAAAVLRSQSQCERHIENGMHVGERGTSACVHHRSRFDIDDRREVVSGVRIELPRRGDQFRRKRSWRPFGISVLYVPPASSAGWHSAASLSAFSQPQAIL